MPPESCTTRFRQGRTPWDPRMCSFLARVHCRAAAGFWAADASQCVPSRGQPGSLGSRPETATTPRSSTRLGSTRSWSRVRRPNPSISSSTTDRWRFVMRCIYWDAAAGVPSLWQGRGALYHLRQFGRIRRKWRGSEGPRPAHGRRLGRLLHHVDRSRFPRVRAG